MADVLWLTFALALTAAALIYVRLLGDDRPERGA